MNYTGLALGLALSFFTKPTDGTALWIANHMFQFPPPAPVLSFADAIFGAAFGSGLLWLVSEAYFRLRGREGMGLGDVKMMLMAGAFLGAKRTLLTILAGSLLGSISGRGRDSGAAQRSRLRVAFWNIPWNGSVTGGFFGTPVVNWYQSLLMVR